MIAKLNHAFVQHAVKRVASFQTLWGSLETSPGSVLIALRSDHRQIKLEAVLADQTLMWLRLLCSSI